VDHDSGLPVDLYGLPPEDFTAARDAAAKDDPSLKALRKPTVSAWVVNTLVRRDSRLLDELAGLGSSLAEAQQNGQATAIRELGEQRRQLVAAVTQRALDLVDRDVSPAVRSEVQDTVEAALADPASAEAVRTGQLVRPLSFAGFGGVDLEGAVAALPSRESLARPAHDSSAKKATKDRTAERAAAAEAKALEAAGVLDDAVRRAESAARALADHDADLATANEAESAAADRLRELQEALAAAENQLIEVRRRRTGLEKDREVLVRKAKGTTKAVAAAQDAADAARTALDRLRRGQ
jgi:hypothetical protein